MYSFFVSIKHCWRATKYKQSLSSILHRSPNYLELEPTYCTTTGLISTVEVWRATPSVVARLSMPYNLYYFFFDIVEGASADGRNIARVSRAHARPHSRPHAPAFASATAAGATRSGRRGGWFSVTRWVSPIMFTDIKMFVRLWFFIADILCLRIWSDINQNIVVTRFKINQSA